MCPALCTVCSDPVAKITVSGSDTLSTAVMEKTLTPVWQEAFQFPARSPDAVITITIEHDKRLGNKFLGRYTSRVVDHIGTSAPVVSGGVWALCFSGECDGRGWAVRSGFRSPARATRKREAEALLRCKSNGCTLMWRPASQPSRCAA